jgi:hypothetical protein
MKIKLSDTDIVTALRPLKDNAVQWQQERSSNRTEWSKRYNQAAYGNERDGFSTSVSSAIWDAIEGIRPSLVEIFTDEWFKLVSENDEQADKNSKLLRYQLYQKNRFGAKLDTWIYDCLNTEFGILKVYHKNESDYEKITVPEMPAEAVDALSQDPEIQITEATKVENYGGPEGYSESYEDVTIIRKVPVFHGPCVEPVPGDEFYLSSGAKDIDSAKLVSHKTRRTLSYIKRREKAGMYRKGVTAEIEDNLKRADDYDDETSQELEERHGSLGGSVQFEVGEVDSDTKEIKPNIEVEVWEHYLKLDIDGDGILEPIIVTECEDIVLNKAPNPYKRPPFRLGRAFPEAHKATGKPMALVLEHEQKVNTNLLRFIQDAAAQSVYKNPITNDPILVEALNRRRPYQVIQANPTGSIGWLETPEVNQFIFKAYEVGQSTIENKTPYSRMSQGSQSDSLNKTARGLSLVVGMAQKKERLIARRLARCLREVLRDFLWINEKWPPEDLDKIIGVDITAEDLLGGHEYTIEIEVGVGPQEKQETALQLDQFIAWGSQVGLQIGAVTPSDLIRAQKRKYKLLGINISEFVQDPDEMEQNLFAENQQMKQTMQQMAGGLANAGISPEQLGIGGGPGVGGQGGPGQGPDGNPSVPDGVRGGTQIAGGPVGDPGTIGA